VDQFVLYTEEGLGAARITLPGSPSEKLSIDPP
jgi:hypothetical protein